MKLIFISLMFGLIACSADRHNETASGNGDSANKALKEAEDHSAESKVYSNTRFRNVTVEKVGAHRFIVHGEAQIFEANFGWVVEDGLRELKKGFELTDAGAPEWGQFKFAIEVEKQRPNSTLTLVLFESSAKDGSRQYELPVVLK